MAKAREDKDRWNPFWAAMTAGLEDFETRINRGWRRFERAAVKDAAKLRALLMRAVDKLDYEDWQLDATAAEALAIQNEFETAASEWAQRQRARLGILPARSKREDKYAIAVVGGLWGVTSGGPADMEAGIVRDGNRTLGRATRAAAYGISATAVSRAVRRASFGPASIRGASRSWVENIVLALEFSIHTARASIIDATSAPTRSVAIRETAARYTPPMQRIKLSYLTHQRAGMRSGIAQASPAFAAGAFAYWLPSDARADAKPEGFGASHYGQIKTDAEWEKVRRNLGKKRPGSYIHTTGFHVGDRGYLIPVPGDLKENAAAMLRQERQQFVEHKRN